jgi:LPS-assembly lipoprotein
MAARSMLKGIVAACVLGLAAPALAGCAGFTPVYARPATVAGMSRIKVETPNTRTGFLLRQDLQDVLAWDRNAPPAYRLTVTIDEHRQARGISENRVATRYEVTVAATYVLTDAGTGQMVLRGNRPIHVTYDTTDQPYAGIVAQQDGQVRAASQAAEQIKTDLLAFFAEQ